MASSSMARARTTTAPGHEARADRTARRADTAPLNAPITAAFVGLLLARELAWAEDLVAVTRGEDGAAVGELPAVGAGWISAGDVVTAQAGAQLTSGKAALGGTSAGEAEVSITPAATTVTAAAGTAAPSVALGGDPMPTAITIAGLQINTQAGEFGSGLVDAEPELTAEEVAEGVGYLAMIENFQLGTDGDDTLIGTDASDYISGRGGDDVIRGRGGDDVLHGDDGDDQVYGDDGNDYVYGDKGNDIVDGGGGSDVVQGGSGDDVLSGGGSDDWGFDNLYGGFGADTYVINHRTDVPDESYVVDSSIDRFTVSAGFIDDFGAAKPYFTAADSFDALPAGLATGSHVHVSERIETILLSGDWDADIYGGGGDNLLVGNAGANTIKGFAGDDVLDGRGGNNRLEGGAGHDTYLVDTRLGGVATIYDSDGASALNANTLRFKGVDSDDLIIARDGDDVTFKVQGVLRARIVDYGADGPVFQVEADDGTFQLLDTNHAPRQAASATAQWSVAEGAVGQYALPQQLFVDVDLDDEVVLEARLADGAPLPNWLSFDAASGRFVATPGQDAAGSYDVAIIATDNQGASASTTFELKIVEVNVAPRALWEDADIIFQEDAAAQALYDLRPYFGDADPGDRLTFSMTSADGAPLPTWLKLDPESGALTGTPTAPLAAPVAVVVTASDGELDASMTLTVAVAPAARALPVAGADVVVTTEDVSAVSGNVLRNDIDPDGGALQATLEGDADHGSVQLGADGSFTYTPDADFSGYDVFWYRALAADGTTSAKAAVTIFVGAENDAPEVDATALAQLNDQLAAMDLSEGASATLSLDAAIFSDVDDAPAALTYTATLDGAPLPGALEGDAWLAFDPASRTFAIRPGPNDGGVHDILLTARDASGAASSVQIALDVADANAAPFIVQPYTDAAVNEGAILDLAPLAHFDDTDVGDTLRLEVRLQGGAPLPEWIVLDQADATLQIVPGAAAYDFGHQPDNTLVLELRAVDRADGEGGLASDWTSWRLDVVPLPDLVATPPEVVTAYEDTALAPLQLAGRFTEAPGAALAATVVGGSTWPAWLQFDRASGTFTGTPEEADVGAWTIEVHATDDAGHVEVDSFKLVVEGTNDAPVVDAAAVADFEATLADLRQGDPLTIFVPAGLVADAEGDVVDVVLDRTSLPDSGWLTYDAVTGKLSGTPGNDDVGEVVLRLHGVEKGQHGLESAPFELRFNVANVNDAPEALAGAIELDVNSGEPLAALNAATLFNDIDAGDALTYALHWDAGDGLPAGLRFEGGVLSGTPTLTGEHHLSLTATDAAGATAAVDLTLSVTAPPHADDPIQLGADGALDTGQFDGLAFSTRLWPLSGGNVYGGPGVSMSEVRYWDGLGPRDFMQTGSTGGYDHVALNGPNKAAIVMGAGNNVILGNAGDNILMGQAGDDVLSGGAGDDELYGGADDDVLAGGLGTDHLYGEGGDDRYEIGGLNDGAVDTIFDDEGANVVDFDGVEAGQMSFGMDGADLLIAIDGEDAARIDDFEGAGGSFDIVADDASVAHAALLTAVEEMRAAFGQGDRIALNDVLDGWLARPEPPADPLAAFATASAATLDTTPPATHLAEDAADFAIPAGAMTHGEALSGIAHKAGQEEEQPTYA